MLKYGEKKCSMIIFRLITVKKVVLGALCTYLFDYMAEREGPPNNFQSVAG